MRTGELGMVVRQLGTRELAAADAVHAVRRSCWWQTLPPVAYLKKELIFAELVQGTIRRPSSGFGITVTGRICVEGKAW